MSTPRLFAQTLPSLRLAPRHTVSSIAHRVRCSTKANAPPLPALPSRALRPATRHSVLSVAPQRRTFFASSSVSHGHVEPPKPGEECVLGAIVPLICPPLTAVGFM